MKRKRILPPTYLVISVITMVLLHFLAPISELIPYPWTLFGLVPLAAGITLNLIADSAFRKKQTTVKPFELSTALITAGVFQICRHPMYLGMVLILSGLGIFMGSLSPLIIIAIFAILMELVFVRAEEKMLQQQFGPVWDAYRNKVRKWF
jgi:protein-S-isoprenylcysteine O-methyltransferase Ste14